VGINTENYQWELSSENYQWELSSENYDLVYHHAEKLRFIGIMAYPKTRTKYLQRDQALFKDGINSTFKSLRNS
jgi:hypothetical protein